MRRLGFTLLEVLVALAVFAMAAVVLASSYINVLLGYNVAAQREEAEDDLRFVRAQVLIEPERERLEQGGDVRLPGDRRARWRAELESTSVPDVFRVRLEIELPDAGSRGPVTETFTVLRPTWSDPVERSRLLAEFKDRVTEINERRLAP